MPVTASNLLSNSSGASQSSYVTASVSLAANKLDLLSVHQRYSTAGAIATPTVTGASRTWTQVATRQTTNFNRITLFRSLSASANSGALTIDFGGVNQTRVAWSVNEFTDVALTGTNGADAVVQSAGNSSDAANTLTVTLGAFSSTDNATFGCVVTNETAPAITVGSGFTQLSHQVQTFLGAQTEWKNTNDTTVDWTDSESNEIAGIGVEIKYALAQVGTTRLPNYSFFM